MAPVAPVDFVGIAVIPGVPFIFEVRNAPDGFSLVVAQVIGQGTDTLPLPDLRIFDVIARNESDNGTAADLFRLVRSLPRKIDIAAESDSMSLRWKGRWKGRWDGRSGDADVGINATSWCFWPHNGAGLSDPTATHNEQKR